MFKLTIKTPEHVNFEHVIAGWGLGLDCSTLLQSREKWSFKRSYVSYEFGKYYRSFLPKIWKVMGRLNGKDNLVTLF